MNRAKIIFQSIGVIRSPHQKLSDIPIQPVFSNDIKGTVANRSRVCRRINGSE